MIYNHNELQDLKISDFKNLLNRAVKITFLKPIKLKGYEEEQYELLGVVTNIGISANTPHLPVDLTIKNEKANEHNINLSKMESLETE